VKIAFTWDYELFFGEKSGTVQNCMIKPTDDLLQIAEENNAKFTFFPDAGYLVKAKQYESALPDLELVINQIKLWDARGHETGLHIHPHWEDVNYQNNEWIHNTNRYKISDFDQSQANTIIMNYFTEIQQLISSPVRSFRAGGWCIQPFLNFRDAFLNLGISIDSTAFYGGKNTNSPYYYDFINVPNKTSYRFDKDILIENHNGPFLELPITSLRYSPLFFWRLFLLGRWDPFRHKPIGNGIPAQGGGSKKALLSKYHTLCLSADGYFISQLEKALKTARKEKKSHLVVIGHPKACTLYSLEKLNSFMSKFKEEVEFVSLNQVV
jgi:hypothetical protein